MAHAAGNLRRINALQSLQSLRFPIMKKISSRNRLRNLQCMQLTTLYLARRRVETVKWGADANAPNQERIVVHAAVKTALPIELKEHFVTQFSKSCVRIEMTCFRALMSEECCRVAARVYPGHARDEGFVTPCGVAVVGRFFTWSPQMRDVFSQRTRHFVRFLRLCLLQRLEHPPMNDRKKTQICFGDWQRSK